MKKRFVKQKILVILLILILSGSGVRLSEPSTKTNSNMNKTNTSQSQTKVVDIDKDLEMSNTGPFILTDHVEHKNLIADKEYIVKVNTTANSAHESKDKFVVTEKIKIEKPEPKFH